MLRLKKLMSDQEPGPNIPAAEKQAGFTSRRMDKKGEWNNKKSIALHEYEERTRKEQATRAGSVSKTEVN